MNSVIQKEFVKIALEFKKRTLPKKEDAFTYKNIADDMWVDLWKEAKDHFSVAFDWENNDSTGQKRVITFTDNSDKDISFDYKFNCDLWSAGGDWEYPCYYFKCQIVDGSTSIYDDDKLPFPGPVGSYRDSHFILIPPKDGGNARLVKGDNYKWVAPHNGDVKDEDVPELDPKKAWEWLENYLKAYIDAYFKNKQAYQAKQQPLPDEPTAGQTKSATIDYSKYIISTPEDGGEYYCLRLPIGVTPPKDRDKIKLNGIDVVVFGVSTPDDIAKGRGGPVARSMRENNIAYSINCLPEGHEYLKGV